MAAGRRGTIPPWQDAPTTLCKSLWVYGAEPVSELCADVDSFRAAVGVANGPSGSAPLPTGRALDPQLHARHTMRCNSRRRRALQHFLTIPTATTTTAVFICS